MTSAYTLLGQSKKTKKFAVKLLTRKRKHFGVPYYIIDIPIYLNICLMITIYLQKLKFLFGSIYPKMSSFKGIYFLRRPLIHLNIRSNFGLKYIQIFVCEDFILSNIFAYLFEEEYI